MGKTKLRRAGFRAAVSAAAAALSVAMAAQASANTNPTWSSTIPAVTSLSGAAVTAGPTGQTVLTGPVLDGGALWPVVSGSPLATSVPYSWYGTTTSQTVRFLPNGDAIVAVYDGDANQTYFFYRFANGSYGSDVVTFDGEPSFAANSDELLVTSAGDGASVTSYTIGSGGSLTKNGSSIQIFTDGTLFGESWTALDPNGTAEVLINAIDEQAGTPDYGDGYMAEIQRTSAGAWQTPQQLPGTSNADPNGLQVAVSPTGRMIAMWPVDTEISGYWYTLGIYAAIRESGGSFGSPTQLLNQSSVPVGGLAATTNLRVAAGPDGTLAATVGSETCPNMDISTDKSSSTSVWIASPGGSLASYGVPGSTLTQSTYTAVTALGAGDGRAIVGLNTTQVVDATNSYGGTPWDEASCGEQEGYPSQTSNSDDAVILGPNVDVASPAFGSGGQIDTNPGTNVDVDAAAIDPNGNATVIGDLTGASAAGFATFGSVGSPYTPPAGGTTTTGGGTTTTGSGSSTTPSGASTTPSGSSATPSGSSTVTPQIPPKQTPAAIKTITPDIVGQNGDQSFGASNTSNALENISIAEWAYQSGLTTALAKSRRVMIASGHLRLKPHKSGTVKLHLSRTARNVLSRKGGRLKVTIEITTQAAGHRTTVITRTLTLRLRKTPK
jgi:hypothetical protein